MPVFHDDQHGTAIVVLAALQNALRVVGKDLTKVSVVVSGAGAAGSAITRLLLERGVGRIVVCDSQGVLDRDRDLHGEKRWLARHTDSHGAFDQGVSLGDALAGADVFIGVSAPGLLDADDLAGMAEDAIVFGLANPDPEFDPDTAREHARVVATGRSDLPNQINNVLAFPGVFRGLLDGRVTRVDSGLLGAAADAIAGLVEEPHEESIVPDVLDERLVPAVAGAVARRGTVD